MPSFPTLQPKQPRLPKAIRSARPREVGQTLAILAVMMFALLAFVGLATDGALMYVRYQQLRRAVDAAALSVAGQWREAQSTADLSKAALEAMQLQGLQPTSIGDDEVDNPLTTSVDESDDGVDNDGDGCIDDPLKQCYTIQRCIDYGALPEVGRDGDVTNVGYNDPLVVADPDICTYPARKLVRVEASTSAQFVFMRLFGWERVRLNASAASEAAALDVILVLDTSYSMTYDASASNGVDDDGDGCIDEGAGDSGCDEYADDWLGAQATNNGKAFCLPTNPCFVSDGGNGWDEGDLPDTTPNCTTSAARTHDPDGLGPETSVEAWMQANNYLPSTINYEFTTGVPTQVVPLSVCRPFEYIRDAAVQFVEKYIDLPYDRVAVITFASSTCPSDRTYDYCVNTTDPTKLHTQTRLTLAQGTTEADIIKVLSTGGTLSDGTTAPALTVSAPPPCHAVDDAKSLLFPNNFYGGEDLVSGSYVQGTMGECENTDTGGGLALALTQLQGNVRSNAVRIVIMLSDGAASTTAQDNWDGGSTDYYACPIYLNTGAGDAVGDYLYGDSSFYRRPCQDGDSRNFYLMRHDTTDGSLYDADDYARDEADLISQEPNVLVFSIGLGPAVTSSPICNDYVPVDTYGTGVTTNDNPDCAPNGEQLLRYIADQGDGVNGFGLDPCEREDADDDGDGTQDAGTWPTGEEVPDPSIPAQIAAFNSWIVSSTTAGVPHSAYSLYRHDIGESCGNYYYAAGGVDVKSIFDEIASRIFTRLTQ
jgi:hypothetical protein